MSFEQSQTYPHFNDERAQALPSTPEPNFKPQPVDMNSIILVIKKLNNSKAIGSDDKSLAYLRDALPVVMIWNYLSKSLKDAESICTFKARLKQYL